MGSNETLTDLLGIYYKGTVVLLFKEGRSVHSGSWCPLNLYLINNEDSKKDIVASLDFLDFLDFLPFLIIPCIVCGRNLIHSW